MKALLSAEEIGRRGKSLYETRIRPLVEAGNHGKYLYINIETGEYELDGDRIAASRRAMKRFQGVPLYGLRVGYPSMGSIGIANEINGFDDHGRGDAGQGSHCRAATPIY